MTVEGDLETAMAAIETVPPISLTDAQRKAMVLIWKRLSRAIGSKS